MPQVMANNANGNGAVLNAQRPQRDPSPELQRGGCFGKLWCLGSRKRGMRIAPARQEGPPGASNGWASNGPSSSTAPNQFVGLSPSLLAPPSSPASFANSGNPSTVQSPAGFTVSLCVNPAAACSPAFDSTATMFTIGPYAHETTLVTPPAFSAFTTAPSTAPFTPPPELAHLTTPSSPDVPFAQLLASSLKNAKGSVPAEPAAPYSASPFASPDYVSRGDMQSSYQMYPESPLGSLISPASGISESGPPSPLPELEFPAAATAARLRSGRVSAFSMLEPVMSLRQNEVATTMAGADQNDSNNHSRELEPIKILSPLKELVDLCRINSDAERETTTSNSDGVSSLEDQQHHPLKEGLQDRQEDEAVEGLDLPHESRPAGSDSPEAEAGSVQRECIGLSDGETANHLQLRRDDVERSRPLSEQQHEEEEGKSQELNLCTRSCREDREHDAGQEVEAEAEQCNDMSKSAEEPVGALHGKDVFRNGDCPVYFTNDLQLSNGIILKVEITADDRVRLNMTHDSSCTPKGGGLNGYLLNHNGYAENGDYKQSEASFNSEEFDTMSLDCMELNLADDTIKGNGVNHEAVSKWRQHSFT